jgi:hypothetical protein
MEHLSLPDAVSLLLMPSVDHRMNRTQEINQADSVLVTDLRPPRGSVHATPPGTVDVEHCCDDRSVSGPHTDGENRWVGDEIEGGGGRTDFIGPGGAINDNG